MSTDSYDYLFKILLVGNSGVGKSSILNQFVDKVYHDEYISTIGVDFKIHTLKIDDKTVKLQVWDTAGQERFRTITNSYYRGAHGILLVYDITDRQSFLDISNWQKEIEHHAKSNVIRVLIGNKCDLKRKRQVSEQEGRELANQMLIPFLEASAKANQNVIEAFIKMARKISELEGPLIRSPTQSSVVLIGNPINPTDKGYCC